MLRQADGYRQNRVNICKGGRIRKPLLEYTIISNPKIQENHALSILNTWIRDTFNKREIIDKQRIDKINTERAKPEKSDF